MKKVFIFLVVLFLTLVFMLFVFSVYFFDMARNEEIVKINVDEKGAASFEVREEEKTLLKNIARIIGEFVYDKATKYNPEGDLLPDEIDNRIKDKVKEKIN